VGKNTYIYKGREKEKSRTEKDPVVRNYEDTRKGRGCGSLTVISGQ